MYHSEHGWLGLVHKRGILFSFSCFLVFLFSCFLVFLFSCFLVSILVSVLFHVVFLLVLVPLFPCIEFVFPTRFPNSPIFALRSRHPIRFISFFNFFPFIKHFVHLFNFLNIFIDNSQ